MKQKFTRLNLQERIQIEKYIDKGFSLPRLQSYWEGTSPRSVVSSKEHITNPKWRIMHM